MHLFFCAPTGNALYNLIQSIENNLNRLIFKFLYSVSMSKELTILLSSVSRYRKSVVFL